jgi:23S rRNA (uridine2552-2'-O)-methyltransferase
MKLSKSSRRWLQEHFDDEYVKRAQSEGYRSRAVYKLKEVDEKEHLIRPGMTVVDLGAAPGGWTQYAQERLKNKGVLVALDLLPMEPIPGVHMLLGDFREECVLTQLLAVIPEQGVDLIISDMAPNMSGTPEVDMPRSMFLAELVFDLTEQVLKPGGNVFMKLFHGEGFDNLVKQARSQFNKVVIRKPQASRQRSRETYLLAKGYRGVATDDKMRENSQNN